MLFEAISIYRDRFEPSAQLDKPYVMVGTMGVIADTDDEARYLFTSAQQQFVNIRRNARGKYPRPVDSMDGYWSDMEKMTVEHTLQFAVVGSKETAEAKMRRFVEDTGADEVIISFPVHDIEARLKAMRAFAQLEVFAGAYALV
jgi:alkanesulfonate monooxygenase SsuD/methylene tetrahydromethanopterin reductase-like flavin-dependent oxidoreductase (luciferase family)